MKKIALIGDTHFSRRSENPNIRKLIRDGQYAYFDHIIKILKEKDIDTVLFTGDIHDTRVSINVEALVLTRRLLKEKFAGFKKHIILGNHDLYYENSYDITSLELFQDIPDLTLHINKVGKIDLLGKTWYFVPWLLKENEDKFVKFLETLNGKSKETKDNTVIFGHFDMMGIEMEAGSMSVVGIDPNMFTNAAKLTISGHYHGKSITKKMDNTILYTGSPYPYTFANSDEEHGIWILDEDLNFEFLRNDISPTFKTIWDTQDLDNLPDMKNSFVRFYFDRDRTPEETAMMKIKIEAKTPIICNSIPYSNEFIKHNVTLGTDGAPNEFLHMDTMKISELYVNLDQDNLPELKFYKDAKEEILKRVKNFSEEVFR